MVFRVGDSSAGEEVPGSESDRLPHQCAEAGAEYAHAAGETPAVDWLGGPRSVRDGHEFPCRYKRARVIGCASGDGLAEAVSIPREHGGAPLTLREGAAVHASASSSRLPPRRPRPARPAPTTRRLRMGQRTLLPSTCGFSVSPAGPSSSPPRRKPDPSTPAPPAANARPWTPGRPASSTARPTASPRASTTCRPPPAPTRSSSFPRPTPWMPWPAPPNSSPTSTARSTRPQAKQPDLFRLLHEHVRADRATAPAVQRAALSPAGSAFRTPPARHSTPSLPCGCHPGLRRSCSPSRRR